MAKPKKANKPKKQKKDAEPLAEDMYDEVDEFHKQKDKIMLNGADDKDEDESEDDFGVYDLQNDSDDEDDSVDDDRLERLEEEERRLRAKLQLQQGEDSGLEDDDASEDDAETQKWGRKKGAYYEAGELDEEEDLLEEEAEAKRLQTLAAQNLTKQDFGLDSDDESDAEDEDLDTLDQLVEREELGPQNARKEAAGSAEDAEELQALFATFKTSLDEVRSRIGPLLKEVKEGKLVTAEGLSYLETKNLLLLQYLMHLVYYFLLRAEGKPVRSHPVISRLVEIRTYLEKVRPIDKKLQYQINKLLTSQQQVKANMDSLEEAELDPLQFRPNPEALVPKTTGNEAAGAEAGGLYKPPMLNPVAMEADPDKDPDRRKRRAAEEKTRRSARSQMVTDLAREFADAPDEIREGRATEDTYGARQREKLQRRAAEEEELMMRVPLAKAELKGLRAAQNTRFSGGAMLDDFADDVADLVQAASEMDGGGRLSQKFGADLAQQNLDRGLPSGDAELPSKASLAVRRANVDSSKARKSKAALDSDEEPEEMALRPNSKRRKTADDDNELYNNVARQAASKKAARQAKYNAPELSAPLDDELEDGPRRLSKAVEKNRGLTPHRRKDAKNPRLKARKKFEKATIRRRGQVQAPRAQSGSYGGEQTGIKAGVSKSRKL